MDKLGFTWYPQDWWSSDTFFDFNELERYVYLECIFIMYRNDGYLKTQKTQFENRIRIKISDEIWEKVTSKFLKTDDGFTSLTVNKRLKKAAISRQNGKSGGRPRNDENPENPESKPKEKEKGKGKKESKSKRETVSLTEFYLHFDSLWKEGMKFIHKGKDLDKAISEVYGAYISDPVKFTGFDSQRFRAYVNTWLSNMRIETVKQERDPFAW
jgi:hypothetical protein